MQRLFLRHAAVPWIAGGLLAGLIALLLYAVGAFSGTELPASFANQRQLLGVNLLLVLVPSYLLAAWGLVHRRSSALLHRVDSLHPDGRWLLQEHAPWPWLLVGAVAGGIYGIAFNLPVSTVDDLLRGGAMLGGLVACMVFLWVFVGVVIAARLFTSGVFLSAGRVVPIDPWEQSSLEPFARNGMADLLFTVGVLALTSVQSIDATFRGENYLFASAVAVPSGLALLMRPMLSVHQRLKALRNAELVAVQALISAAQKGHEPAQIAHLETLLQRRDRVRSLPVWPLNTAMVSRLFLYGVIPPVAWVAAALVELVIERAVG